ncbi:MAG: hypothetical protein R2849_03325 [Thermomicrobiales bacterium]
MQPHRKITGQAEMMTDDDLDLIYVLIDIEWERRAVSETIRDLTDKEFRNRIVPFANYHGVQVLPSLGRIGMETRLSMINYSHSTRRSHLQAGSAATRLAPTGTCVRYCRCI